MATAASPRYPGWTITTETRQGRKEWTMVHESGIYAVAVYAMTEGYAAELMTQQRWEGGTSWEPARTPAEGTPREVVTEAERRVKVMQGTKRHAA